jgi:hypothetical protein
VACSIEKGHGRIEKRTLRTTNVLTKTQDWAGLKQGYELRRERTVRCVTTVEVVYGITSLDTEKADDQRLLELSRGQEQIAYEPIGADLVQQGYVNSIR